MTNFKCICLKSGDRRSGSMVAFDKAGCVRLPNHWDTIHFTQTMLRLGGVGGGGISASCLWFPASDHCTRKATFFTNYGNREQKVATLYSPQKGWKISQENIHLLVCPSLLPPSVEERKIVPQIFYTWHFPAGDLAIVRWYDNTKWWSS